jgi:hypothetical protein
MAAFGAIDIPARGVDDFRKTLRDREEKLVHAKKQRDVILNDIRKTNAAIDAGDKRARLELMGLNKQNAAAGRLILSIEAEVAQSRKRVAMAESQAEAAAVKRASIDNAALVRDKWFETICPDGRKVRHRHHSLEALQRELQPGYLVAGQVFGADENGAGGFVSMPGAPSMLKAMLESEGDVLMAYLAARGISADKQPVVVLPSNGRDMQ